MHLPRTPNPSEPPNQSTSPPLQTSLGHNDSTANWDLLALYAGTQRRWDCGPACAATLHSPGLKWGLLARLTQSNFWPDIRARYRYIMFPDGDLRFEPCAVAAVFDAMAAYDLALAAPSICVGGGSYTRQAVSRKGFGMRFKKVAASEGGDWELGQGCRPLLQPNLQNWLMRRVPPPWPTACVGGQVAYQSPGSLLRFANYAGLSSPAFEMRFFDQQVRRRSHMGRSFSPIDTHSLALARLQISRQAPL